MSDLVCGKNNKIPTSEVIEAINNKVEDDDFQEHVSDKDNPHETTPEKISAAHEIHNHTESDIVDLDKYTQAEVDVALALKSDESNTMTLDGNTPSPDYSIAPNTVPANKQYVLDTVTNVGSGDMTKAVYDQADSGVVDTTEGIGLQSHSMGVSPYNQIMRVSQATFEDANLVDDLGIYIGTDVTNTPNSGRVLVNQWIDSNGDKLQVAFSYLTNKWYRRSYTSSLWSVWIADAVASDLVPIEAELALKADITYVDDEIATRVPQTSVTGSATLPVGTTAERDVTPTNGMIRYNADDDSFEGYANGEWGAIGGGGGLPDETGKDFQGITTEGVKGDAKWTPFTTTPNTVSEDYTVKTGSNATIVSPTIADGVTVTVEDGATLVTL